jgi:Domain of unknown function DUF11
VIRKHLGRVATALTTAALLGAMVGAAPASARTPGWQFLDVQQLPATVADGGVAGFSFRIFNNGKSNISALYLTDTTSAPIEYIATSRGTAVCQTVPTLRCSFGALNSKASINVTIAYRVGTTNFTNTFKLDSTGDPAGGNNSHGDSLPLTLTTAVNSDEDYDGGFTIDTSALQTGGTLGNGNKQTTGLVPPSSLIPATIEDGITTGIACGIAACANQVGEWSRVNVNNGSTFGNAFKVTLMVWGGSVPGGTSAADLFLLHTRDNGTTYVIDTDCNSATAPTNAECITVTKIGSNFRIVAWLFTNGGLRGGY